MRERAEERRERMMMRIREDLETAPDVIPEWARAARTLADRLIISHKAYFYLAYFFAECALYSASVSDPELVRLSAEVETIERSYGLREDESFHLDDAPEDWSALNDQWNARADLIIDGVLRAAGCADVAEAMRDRNAFDTLTDEGRREIWRDEALD